MDIEQECLECLPFPFPLLWFLHKIQGQALFMYLGGVKWPLKSNGRAQFLGWTFWHHSAAVVHRDYHSSQVYHPLSHRGKFTFLCTSSCLSLKFLKAYSSGSSNTLLSWSFLAIETSLPLLLFGFLCTKTWLSDEGSLMTLSGMCILWKALGLGL